MVAAVGAVVVHRNENAQTTVEVGAAVVEVGLLVPVLLLVVVGHPKGKARERRGEIEGSARDEIDRAADRVAGQIGRDRLEEFDALEALGGEGAHGVRAIGVGVAGADAVEGE